MAQYDGSIRINTEIEYRNAQKELKKLESSISKTSNEIASLRSKMDALKDAALPTKEYQEIYDYLKNLETEFDKLLKQQEQMQSEGRDSGEAWNTLNSQMDEIGKRIRIAEQDLRNLVDTGKAFSAGFDSDKYAEMSAQMEQLNQKMKSDTERQSELQSQIAEREEHLAQIRENAVVGNQRIIETVERIKQLEQEIADLKSAGVTEGYEDYDSRIQELEHLKQEVRGYRDGVNEIKERYSELGAVARRALSSIENLVKKVAISSFKSLGKEIKKVTLAMFGFGKSTKNSNNILKTGFKNILKYGLGIRSVYVLVNKLRTAIKEGFSNMAKEVDGFKVKVNSLKASTLTLKNSFAAAFRPLVETALPYIQMVVDAMSNLLDMVGQFTAAITGQKSYTKAIKQTTAAIEDENKAQNKQLSGLDKLNNLSSGSGGGADSRTSSKMFEENVPISDKFANIAQWLKDMWANADFTELGVVLGKKLKEALDSIPWESISEIASKISKSLATLINGFVKVEGLEESIAHSISNFFNTYIDSIYTFITTVDWKNLGEKVGKNISDAWTGIDWKKAGETLGETFKAFFDFVGNAIENVDWWAVGESVKDFLVGIDWAGVAESFFEAIGAAIGGLAAFLGGLIADGVEAAKEYFQDKIEEAGGNVVEGILVGIAEALVNIGEWINEHIFQPFIEGFKKAFDIHSPSGVMEEMGIFLIRGLFNGISSLINKVISLFVNIKSKVIGIWNVLQTKTTEIWNGIKDAIKTPINSILGFVESLANGVISAINFCISALNNISFNIPDWLKYVPGLSDLAGKTFGFNIPELKEVSIPRLATGTVVPPNREFMAVLGDNKSEPEVVSPISTIEQAVENVLRRNGGMDVGEITIKIPVEIDGNVFFELIKKLDLQQFNRTGRPSFQI